MNNELLNETIGNIKGYIRYIVIWLVYSVFRYKDLMCVNSDDHILIIRTDEIGDVVMTTPLLRCVREKYPHTKITLIVKPAVYNLFEICPYVNRVIVFDKYKGRLSFFINIFKTYEFVKHNLYTEKYKMAIVPRWDSDSGYYAGMISFFSRARRRIGYSSSVLPSKAERDNGYDLFYTDIVPSRRGVTHEINRTIDILRYLNIEITEEEKKIELWQSAHDVEFANEILQENDKVRIVVALSAGRSEKEWNVEKYSALCRMLMDVYGDKLQFILVGAGESAEAYAKIFVEKIKNTINLINICSLRESYAVLKKCDVYIGGDTGPLHMAVAAGLSGVSLFLNPDPSRNEGLDSPKRFGPWNSRIEAIVPSKGLGSTRGDVCIDDISIEKVLERIKPIIADVIKRKAENE